MVKKTKLHVVVSTPTDPAAPPPHLDKTGAALWRSVMSEYDLSDSGGLELLSQACSAADRAAEFAAVIDTDGSTIRTKAGLREHPLLKHELASRAFVCRTLQRLGLDVEPVRTVGRPGHSTSWTPVA